MRRRFEASRLLVGGALCAFLHAVPAQAADARIAEALAARSRGDNISAIKLLRAASADAPNDADTLRLLGTTLAFAHQYPEAIADLKRAQTLSPHDADIAVALSRTLLWSGKLDAAERVARDIEVADPHNPETADLLDEISAAKRDSPKMALDVVETASRVSIGAARLTWRETAAALSVPITRSTAIVAGIDAEDRVTSTDTRFSLRADRRFAWGTAYVASTVTPSATFRERWSVLTGVVAPLTPILEGSLEVRRAHYDMVDVTVIEAGARIHSTQDHWALTAHSINLWGEDTRHHFGWSLRGDLLPTKSVRLFGGAATYSDTETGVTRRVDSAFVGGAFAISSRLEAQLVADHEVRHESYRRDGITIGVHWRFGR